MLKIRHLNLLGSNCFSMFYLLPSLICIWVYSDFVTGFHKRKKKRRKEAQSQQQEALRRKRIELRKKVIPPYVHLFTHIQTLHSVQKRNSLIHSLMVFIFFFSFCWQRKLEREYVIYGGAPPGQDGEANENGEVKEAEADEEDEEEDDDDEHLTSVSGT